LKESGERKVRNVNIGAVEKGGLVPLNPVGGGEQVRSQMELFPVRQREGEDQADDSNYMRRIVQSMQEQIDSLNVSLQYSTYGERGERIAVAVVNRETGELIREIPPKELRELYEKMSEIAGMIFNREI
jgi:flagellar protein FlaG